MKQTDIICKATTDTFLRFGVVLLALLGFAIYFVYDATVGYYKKNEVYCSYKAFAELGEQATKETNAAAWKAARESTPLLPTQQVDGRPAMQVGGVWLPLPADCPAAASCPQETLDLQAMKTAWFQCWTAYTGRVGMPQEPGEKGMDAQTIFHQWVAAAGAFSLFALGMYFVLRTARRELALRGQEVTAAGMRFAVADIECIDLRQWGPGFKGVAYFTVKGKKVRVDGMTYGGFNKEKGEPAEQFMQAVLASYNGDIIEYEQTETPGGDAAGATGA